MWCATGRGRGLRGGRRVGRRSRRGLCGKCQSGVGLLSSVSKIDRKKIDCINVTTRFARNSKGVE
jgi:hypothetical protein